MLKICVYLICFYKRNVDKIFYYFINQCDEQRITDILSDTNKLRQDVHELRYLDDLLKLLRGELERISKRNWPFVIGHTNHSEEMNLIV